MKAYLLPFLLLGALFVRAQDIDLSNEPGEALPFGEVHRDYTEQLSDFAPMIGICDCRSVNRGPDGNWQDTVAMIWKFKYIMNGTAIQDETWKADGRSSGSIRQFIADSAQWAVTYFSAAAPAASPGVWMGGKQGDDVVLYMDQKAPNGMEGRSRLTFYNIGEYGYDWIGEWTSLDESFVYPFWSISCTKRDD